MIQITNIGALSQMNAATKKRQPPRLVNPATIAMHGAIVANYIMVLSGSQGMHLHSFYNASVYI